MQQTIKNHLESTVCLPKYNIFLVLKDFFNENIENLKIIYESVAHSVF